MKIQKENVLCFIAFFLFLFYSCPYDVVKAYDIGQMNGKASELTAYDDELIEAYCGIKKNFTIYSTKSLLLIKFETSDSLGNNEYNDDESKVSQRRGFKAFFKFSKDFVNLSFITGRHIKGTSKLFSLNLITAAHAY